MIQINNLVKVYGKGEDSLTALNGINVTLPNTGLVFILGKSGCGKSTLLNMLGGLDDITSGDILFDGVSISNLSEIELNNYRNNYVGIIYQNFNLFENETVYKNIYVAAKQDNKDTIKETIEKVIDDLMLSQKKDTLVKNLSGGQKQRVAIARALIKESKVILADEPTGNLDSKNTAVTFDILKEVAKERLVVVVSHDNKSAFTYGDRIISLSDGQIISDVSRNENYEETTNNIIELPQDSDINEEEINVINQKLTEHKLEIRKNNKKYLTTTQKEYEIKEKPDFKIKKKNITSPLDISSKFFKSCISSFIVTVIIISIIISLLAFCKNFILFDEADAISVINEEYGAKDYILTKDYSFYDDPKQVNKSYLIATNENDKKIFKDEGYTGNIYELYNQPTRTSSIECNTPVDDSIYNDFYSTCGLGAAVVNIDYLTKIFGKIEVIAGSLYNLENSDALIVTDYFADSILYHDLLSCNGIYISNDDNDPYQKIVNTILEYRYKIGAIIKTNYKEKYKYLIDLLERIKEEPQNQTELLKELSETDLLSQFYMEADNSLNIAYSINPNYKESILSKPNEYIFTNANNLVVGDKSLNLLGTFSCMYFWAEDSTNDLSQGEISLSYTAYNKLFNTNITKDDESQFEEQTINILAYRFDENAYDLKEGKDVGLIYKLKVVDVWNDYSNAQAFGYLSYEDFYTLKDYMSYSYALIFDDVSQCYNVHTTAKNNYFYSNLTAYSSVFTICDIIVVFEKIFTFVFIVLIAIAAIILLSYSLRLIKKNQYLIGVYKSLGYQSSIFVQSSILNSIYLNVVIYAFSLIFSFATNYLINYILTTSFAKMLNFPLIKSMHLVSFSFPLITVYIGVVLGVSLLMLLIPILKIRKLKPNTILHKAIE